MIIILDFYKNKEYNVFEINNISNCYIGGILMKAHIDREACIGCGLCNSICPEVFEMDDEDIAIVIANPIPEDAKDSAQEAADSCPTDAISIEE